MVEIAARVDDRLLLNPPGLETRLQLLARIRVGSCRGCIACS